MELTKEEEKVITLYESGLSTRQLSDKLNITRYKVNKIIKKSNIKIRNNSESKIKYYYNSNYFSIIDNENKAYILGLIYADGNVCIKGARKRLQIALNSRDEATLRFILKELGDGTLYKDRDCKKIIIFNDEIVNNLIRLGCIPKKSLVLEFPTEEQVPKEFIHHFIRGYFDGDGSICIVNSVGYTISFTGVEKFLQKIKDVLLVKDIELSKFYIRYKDRPNTAGSMVYYETTNKTCKFFNYIYKDATTYMKRKYDKMKKIIDEHKSI